MHIPPTAPIRGIAFVAKLLLAGVFQSLEDRLANAFVTFCTRHSIDFSQHDAGDAMIIVSCKRAGHAVPNARNLVVIRTNPPVGHDRSDLRILQVEDVIDRSFNLRAVRTLSGLMTAGQAGHDAKASDPGLAFVLGRERSIRLLAAGEKFQPSVDGAIQSFPLLGRQKLAARRWPANCGCGRGGTLLRVGGENGYDLGETYQEHDFSTSVNDNRRRSHRLSWLIRRLGVRPRAMVANQKA